MISDTVILDKTYTLTRFNPQTATDAEFAARHVFLNSIRAEAQPDDPPRTLRATIDNAKGWQVFEDIDIQVWEIVREGEVLAELFANIAHREDNRHLMDINLNVLPTHRRRGLGTALLGQAVRLSEANGRTLLISFSHANAPAGASFAEEVGAKAGLTAHTNRLVLADLEPSLLHDWQESARVSASDFTVGLWAGPYPEEEITAIADLHTVMNTAPMGDLEVEDFTVTPAHLRQREAYHGAQGVERWTLYARHASGELAGYTALFIDPETPETLYQGDTGVLPKYRGHGLGKWLKAAMLEKVLAERPTVKFVRTGNADENVPMLKINHALGFKPYLSETVWQVGGGRAQRLPRSEGGALDFRACRLEPTLKYKKGEASSLSLSCWAARSLACPCCGWCRTLVWTGSKAGTAAGFIPLWRASSCPSRTACRCRWAECSSFSWRSSGC